MKGFSLLGWREGGGGLEEGRFFSFKLCLLLRVYLLFTFQLDSEQLTFDTSFVFFSSGGVHSREFPSF